MKVNYHLSLVRGNNIRSLYTNDDKHVHVGVCMFNMVTDGSVNKRTLHISYLEILPKYRRYGLASFLLYDVLKTFYSNGIKQVLLSDASDWYGSDDNIYIKMGLNYVDDYDNEMLGNLRHILYGKRSKIIANYEKVTGKFKIDVVDVVFNEI